jgi:PhnB protein
MTGKVKPIPDGYHSITPYLSIRGATEAIAFYKQAFGAEEIYRLDMPGGKVGHAELQIGNSRIMLSDEFPEMPDAMARSPQTLDGTSIGLCIYLPDVDAALQRATLAGATIQKPLQDQFYGDRTATVRDPYGHVWTLMTHIEDVKPDEMRKRMAALYGA